MIDTQAPLWLARLETPTGPRVVIHRDGITAHANVDSREFEDLPELIAAAAGDWSKIGSGEPIDPSGARVLSPLGRPSKILCVGLNYLLHVQEAGLNSPPHPPIFAKWHTALAGPYDDIPLPAESTFVDWEAELAVVIGRSCRRVTEDDVASVLFGYTASNDVSMRDYQSHSQQFQPGKSWDAATPLGPVVVPSDPDPAQLDLLLEGVLNGEEVQSTSTKGMIHTIPRIVSYISTWMTLEPGDVILTGTPGGVGLSFEPTRSLTDGDVFEVRLDKVGHLRNMFKTETPAAYGAKAAR